MTRRLLALLRACAGIGAAVLAWSMARMPAVYTDCFYGRGGALRTLQVFVCDVLGPTGVVIVALAIAFALAKPSRVRRAIVRFGRILARMPRRAFVALLVLVGIAAAAALSARTPAPRSAGTFATARRPNVLLLVVGSLRADRLSSRVTPSLASFAARATSFDEAHVSRADTEATLAALLTGRERGAAVPDALPTRLARAGYECIAVGDAPAVSARDLGFDRVQVEPVDALARDPMRIASRASAVLRERRERPLFLTAFFATPGPPYAAPSPFHAKYTDRAYRGAFKYAARTRDAAPFPSSLDAADAAQVRGLYDGALAAVDDAVSRVLATLASEGLDDDTIVVLTSDHGDHLFEHARGNGASPHLFGHAGTHVPLVVRDPRREHAPARVRAVVRDVDLAPTLYRLTGVEPPFGLDGKDLTPALEGGAVGKGFAFASTPRWTTLDVPGLAPELRLPYRADGERDDVVEVARHRMVRDERWKLVYAPTRSAPRWLLFDTALDPSETHDVASTHPDEVARLRGALTAHARERLGLAMRDGFVVPDGIGRHAPYSLVWIWADELPPDAAATSPAIRALAARGATFTRATSSAPSPEMGLAVALAGVRATELAAAGAAASLPTSLAAHGIAAHASLGSAGDAPSFVLVHLGADASRDEALARTLAAIEASDRRERTIVVLSATRGARDESRFSNALSHVPLVLVAPGIVPAGIVVDAPVATIDLAPTVAELLGFEPHARTQGRSFVSLARGEPEPEPRAVVSEHRGARALLHGRHRLVVDAPGRARLFDVAADPREQRDLATVEPHQVAEMGARLDAALAGAAVAGSRASVVPGSVAARPLRLRFATAGRSRRVVGTMVVGSDAAPAREVRVVPVEVGEDAFAVRGMRVEIALTTLPAALAGLDVFVEPPSAPVGWDVWLDDEPWPRDAVFAGPFGLAAPALVHGPLGERERIQANARAVPFVDPARELGLFVAREPYSRTWTAPTSAGASGDPNP